MMNQSQGMNSVHVMHQMVVNQPPQVHNLNQTRQIQPTYHMLDQSQFMMRMPQVPHLVNRSNEILMPPPGSQSSIESMKFSSGMNREGFAGHGYMHRNWMRSSVDRRRETAGMKSVRLGHGGGYRPPTLNDLQKQNQNRRRFYQNRRSAAPYAPRNTTSFLIRAKRSGGIADLVSPNPVTPSILSTPQLSPSREVLGDMAKEEWGVDGYGSMNGLIRLKSPEHVYEDEEEEDGSGSSSDSDVEEHIEMEKKLDHDLSRFEMIYPNYGSNHNAILENRVNDQDNHISELEKENMLLREKLHSMENEMNDFRKMLQNLETLNPSENDSDGDDDDTILGKNMKMDG